MRKFFIEITPEQIKDNVFHLINKEWMLITAGDEADYNMMTASWGGMGILWNKRVCFCFVRPQRYTFGFMENHDFYTLSFFNNKQHDALVFCGSHSGKDYDKTKLTGLNPAYTKNGSVYFKEARLVIECKKIYSDFIKPENFFDSTINELYPVKDYHKFYIGEITSILKEVL